MAIFNIRRAHYSTFQALEGYVSLISKPIVSRMEVTMSLSVFYFCICAFLCRCRSFKPIFESFFAISAVLCHCSKVRSLVGIVPYQGLILIQRLNDLL